MRSQAKPGNEVGVVWFVLLLLFCTLLFFAGLGERELSSSHEARAAQNAQMILNEGCWDVPRLFDRRVELQKPPLYYWLVALVAWMCGGQVDAWAVRLPAALSALACVGVVVFIGWRRRRPLAGLLAGTVLASFLHFTWLARVGRIDMLLTLALTAALGSFYLGRCEAKDGRRGWLWFAAGYVALALGLLAKGPIAAVLVLIVACAHALLVNPTRQRGMSASLVWGVPLVLALVLPWFVWANHRTGNRLWDVFIWYHNIGRGLGSDGLRSHPWWFYVPRLLVDLAPWSIVVPLAGWHFWRKGGWRGDPEARFALVWLLAMTAFLSCMRFKRGDYLLPAYPGAALFLGCSLEGVCRMAHRHRLRLVSLFLVTLGAYLVGWGVHQACERTPEGALTYRRLAAEIRQRTDGPVIFFRAEAHALMFHVGGRLDTILEWENLDKWASKPERVYFVMPADCADCWREHLRHGELTEILRTEGDEGRSERALVVMRGAPSSSR